MLYAIVALLVIVLDQWVKLWVHTNEALLPLNLIPNVLSLVKADPNPGGAFGFLAGQNATVFFLIAAGVVTLLTIIALSTNLVKGGLGRWCLVFISAGGLSNAIDRLVNDGGVQDMISMDFLKNVRLFGLNGINFPIFNVADVFITVFTLLLILYILFGGNRKAAELEEEEEEDEDEEEEEELEDEDEEEDVRPARRRARKAAAEEAPEAEKPAPEAKPARSRQSYEEEYERYKARKARAAAPAEEPKAEPVVDPQDPFAEWDRANRKAEPEKPAPVQEAPKPAPAPVQEAPKPKPAPAPASEEFSLEDILAEFK